MFAFSQAQASPNGHAIAQKAYAHDAGYWWGIVILAAFFFLLVGPYIVREWRGPSRRPSVTLLRGSSEVLGGRRAGSRPPMEFGYPTGSLHRISAPVAHAPPGARGPEQQEPALLRNERTL